MSLAENTMGTSQCDVLYIWWDFFRVISLLTAEALARQIDVTRWVIMRIFVSLISQYVQKARISNFACKEHVVRNWRHVYVKLLSCALVKSPYNFWLDVVCDAVRIQS